ncbi:MAG: DUF3858 domain-containing protein, partial [Candidatus Taylorbacteria bacterium]
NLKDSLQSHVGNSADINLSLILLLRGLGLDANPVLLSTWNHGPLLEANPTRGGLNYVIACVNIDSLKYLLDATSPNLPMNTLPRRCLNGQGIVVAAGPVRWVDLYKDERNNSLMMGDFKIDSLGNLNGKLDVSKSGYYAKSDRDDFFNNGEESFTRMLSKNMKAWEVGSIIYENMSSPGKNLKISYQLSSGEISQSSGDMIYVNVLCGLGQAANPFISEKRIYPVEFGCPLKDSYVFSFEIPAGFKLETLPESVSILLPNKTGSFRFLTSMKENKILVTSNLSINKAFFTVTEYLDLREFFNRIVIKHSQQIVLKKS